MQQDVVQNKKTIRVPDLPAEIYKDQTQTIPSTSPNTPTILSTTKTHMEKENCDPNYMRATMYTSPGSEFTLEASSIPFSVVATPFSEKGSIQFTCGFDTCADCRTYLNAFTQKAGNGLICNICDKKIDVPVNYPENLSLKSFEYVISSSVEGRAQKLSQDEQTPEIQYPAIKQLLTPIFVFVFDLCSFQLISPAMDAISSIVRDENFQTLYGNVGFLVINNGVTAFGARGGRPVRWRMPGELPFISQRCVVPSKDVRVIDLILREISKMPERGQPETKTISGTIWHMSTLASGCKVALFSGSTAPVNYELLLKHRKNCSVNLFWLQSDPKQHITLEGLAFYSSGRIFKYSAKDAPSVARDLSKVCLTKPVFDVRLVMKVSDNLTKTSFIGSTLDDSLASSHLSQMDSNTAVQFNFGLNGPSKKTKYVQLQAAFTDFDGSRRMRVFNAFFPTGVPAYIFSSVSFDTLFAAMVKLSLSEDANMEKMMTSALVYYRSRCSSNTSTSQFVLPESMKCLPVLVQSYAKKIDIEKPKLINATVEENLRYFYPRLFSLSEFVISANLEQTKNLRLSANSISEDDIYVLENGEKIFIYIPRGVDRKLVSSLFEETNDALTVRKSGDEECMVLSKIIRQIEDHYGYDMKVTICLAGEDASEAEFLMNMVEDKLNNYPDYVDYIFKLHFDVQRS